MKKVAESPGVEPEPELDERYVRRLMNYDETSYTRRRCTWLIQICLALPKDNMFRRIKTSEFMNTMLEVGWLPEEMAC